MIDAIVQRELMFPKCCGYCAYTHFINASRAVMLPTRSDAERELCELDHVRAQAICYPAQTISMDLHVHQLLAVPTRVLSDTLS